MDGRVVTFLCIHFLLYSVRYPGEKSNHFKLLHLKEKNSFMIFVCDIKRSASVILKQGQDKVNGA